MQHQEILKTKKGENGLKTDCLSSGKMIMTEFFPALSKSAHHTVTRSQIGQN